jgi:hypothetical protein
MQQNSLPFRRTPVCLKKKTRRVKRRRVVVARPEAMVRMSNARHLSYSNTLHSSQIYHFLIADIRMVHCLTDLQEGQILGVLATGRALLAVQPSRISANHLWDGIRKVGRGAGTI